MEVVTWYLTISKNYLNNKRPKIGSFKPQNQKII